MLLLALGGRGQARNCPCAAPTLLLLLPSRLQCASDALLQLMLLFAAAVGATAAELAAAVAVVKAETSA